MRRREFLKRVPLFGAGAVLGLNALSEAGETPKARKLSGADAGPFGCNVGGCARGAVCNAGDNTGCNIGTWCDSGACNTGD